MKISGPRRFSFSRRKEKGTPEEGAAKEEEEDVKNESGSEHGSDSDHDGEDKGREEADVRDVKYKLETLC